MKREDFGTAIVLHNKIENLEETLVVHKQLVGAMGHWENDPKLTIKVGNIDQVMIIDGKNINTSLLFADLRWDIEKQIQTLEKELEKLL